MARKKGKRKSSVPAGYDYFAAVPQKYSKDMLRMYKTNIPRAKFKTKKSKRFPGKVNVYIK
jgi:hypothetical protein